MEILGHYCKIQGVEAISVDCRFGDKRSRFDIVIRSSKAEKISNISLVDLFSTTDVEIFTTTSYEQKQLMLPMACNGPFKFYSNIDPSQKLAHSSRPPIECIPEAARLLSVIASGRRQKNQHLIKIPLDDTSNPGICGILDVHLEPSHTKITDRWKRIDSNQMVYVEPNSVTASAVPLNGTDIIYCACANTLEVNGGALRADGLTLLPAGKLFYRLCKVAFGIQNDTDTMCDGDTNEVKRRIAEAAKFHQSSMDLEEQLFCFPDKIKELLSIFNNVDGYESLPWDSLKDNPFINKENICQVKQTAKHQKALQKRIKPESYDEKARILSSHPSLFKMQLSEVRIIEFSKLCFVKNGQMPSAHVCSVIVSEARAKIRDRSVHGMDLREDWELFHVNIENQSWYLARFINEGLPYVAKTAKKKLPHWICSTEPVKPRPSSIADAVACVPKSFSYTVTNQIKKVSIGDETILVFKTLHLAVQMESAFWLERQFATNGKHWFQLQDNAKMIRQLVAEHQRQLKIVHSQANQEERKGANNMKKMNKS